MKGAQLRQAHRTIEARENVVVPLVGRQVVPRGERVTGVEAN